MASSSSSTREIANAWASFYNQYYNALGGVNQSAGPRSKKVDAARKEWTTILNKLRGGNVRHWPTEPDEIRQIQQLLHWEQCDMWSAIDGVTSARDHIRSTASHPAYTSFQGWASEVKGRWDAQKSVGAKTPLPKVQPQPQRAKPKADGGEHLLGLSNPFLVPFSPLYEELNGSLDSAERKHFAVVKSVERQCEFYSMAHEYTANVKNELQEVKDEPGRKELYQRYASSLLILATKLYDEWTKDVMDWKATTDTDDDSEDGDDNDDGSDDDDESGDDEGETDTGTDSLAPNVEITEIRTKEAAPSPHPTNANNADMGDRDNDGAKANLNPRQTTPPSFASYMNRPPLQRPTTRERQPEAPKAGPDLEAQSDPGGEGGDPWPPGMFRSVYFPSTQSADSTATLENRGQEEPSRPHLQRPSRNGNANKEFRKGDLEAPSGSLHSPRPAMDARSLSSKENIHPARGHPDLSDKDGNTKDTLQPLIFPLPPTRTRTFSMGRSSNSVRKAEPVAFPKVDLRTFPPASSPVSSGVPQMKQPSRSDPRPTQTSQTLFSPLPSPRRTPSSEPSLPARNSPIGNIYRPAFQRAASSLSESTASAPSRAVPKSPPFHGPRPVATTVHNDDNILPREMIDQGENIERLSADGVMMWRLKLMEEGWAGYDSQDFVQNERKKVIQASARGSNHHDPESISDVSSIDFTESEESEDEQSDTPAPSKLTPIAGILKGAGTRPNTPTRERSVQFRNSPEVRYI